MTGSRRAAGAAAFAVGLLPWASAAWNSNSAHHPPPGLPASLLPLPQPTPGTLDADLDAVFRAWDREDSPGCAAGALRRGEFVFRDAYGMANLDHGVPLTPDSVFRMASVSKQFTAAAVLAAEDRGLLSLEEPLRKHFPDLPAWAEPVRVRHLIHHTSGIRDYLAVMTLSGHGDDAHYTDAEVLAALRRLDRLNFEPGTEYLYSNSGYWLLGRLISRVSGKTLREFAGEHLFEPLGMQATHFHDRYREIVPGRAAGYRPRPKREARDGRAEEEADGGFELDQTTLEMIGDGGLYTTIQDLRRWERMFLDPAALGPRFAERLVEPGRFSDGSPQDYAAGLALGEYRGLPTVSHGGGFVGFRTHSLRFPEQEFAVFVLCNAANADAGALARRVADLFLEAALDPREAPSLPAVPTADPPIAPGRFWEAASASLAVIEPASAGDGSGVSEGRGLVLVRDGFAAALQRAENGWLTASAGGRQMRLVPQPAGTAGPDGSGGFLLRQPGQRDFPYRRVEPWTPPLAELLPLTGTFRCRELGGAAWEVRSSAGSGLTLHRQDGGAWSLEPAFLDGEATASIPAPVFSFPGGTVRFLPGLADPDRGRPRAFELSVGRARGFLFLRE